MCLRPHPSGFDHKRNDLRRATTMRLAFSFTAPIVTLVMSASIVPLAVAAPQSSVMDWKEQEAEILRHYRALVQIDTSNPPGNETAAVEYLKTVLEAEGIPTKVFALESS